jgi:hypothetical protein
MNQQLFFIQNFFGDVDSNFLNVEQFSIRFDDDPVLVLGDKEYQLETDTHQRNNNNNTLYFFFSTEGFKFRIRLYFENMLTGEIRIKIGKQLYELVSLFRLATEVDFQFLANLDIQNLQFFQEDYDETINLLENVTMLLCDQ